MKKQFITIILLCLLCLGSCARKKIYSSHSHIQKDSTALERTYRDSLVHEKTVTVHDSFHQTIFIDAPCDTLGVLKNGYRQQFLYGKLKIHLAILNNQIRLDIEGGRDSSIVENKAAFQNKELLSVQSHKEKIEVKERVEVEPSLWDKLKKYAWHLLYIPAIILLYEGVSKLLKLVKATRILPV